MWLARLSFYRHVQLTKSTYATSPCLFEHRVYKSIESPLICFKTAYSLAVEIHWVASKFVNKQKTSGVNMYVCMSKFYYASAACCRAAFILFMYAVKCIYTHARQHQYISAGTAYGWLGFMFSVKIHWTTFTWTCYAILWRIRIRMEWW